MPVDAITASILLFKSIFTHRRLNQYFILFHYIIDVLQMAHLRFELLCKTDCSFSRQLPLTSHLGQWGTSLDRVRSRGAISGTVTFQSNRFRFLSCSHFNYLIFNLEDSPRLKLFMVIWWNSYSQWICPHNRSLWGLHCHCYAND